MSAQIQDSCFCFCFFTLTSQKNTNPTIAFFLLTLFCASLSLYVFRMDPSTRLFLLTTQVQRPQDLSHPQLGPTVSLPHIPSERFWLNSFFSWEQRCLPFRSSLLKGMKRKRKSQRLRVNAGRGVSVKEASQQTSGSHGNRAWMLAKHGNVNLKTLLPVFPPLHSGPFTFLPHHPHCCISSQLISSCTPLLSLSPSTLPTSCSALPGSKQ